MRIVVWLLRAFIFFALFAFALNNQQPATVHWFFGVQWQAPMVILVLAAFAAGCVIGVLAMAPHWWRQRRLAQPAAAATAEPAGAAAPRGSEMPSAFNPETLPHPPRDGV
jgi:lipopolysaccharide assembly protein A